MEFIEKIAKNKKSLFKNFWLSLYCVSTQEAIYYRVFVNPGQAHTYVVDHEQMQSLIGGGGGGGEEALTLKGGTSMSSGQNPLFTPLLLFFRPPL